MVLALNQYATMYDAYPSQTGEPRSAVHVALLPYLEQAPLYELLTRHATAQAPQLGVYLCPSSPRPETEPAPGCWVTWTSYAANHGSGVQRFGYNGIVGTARSLVRPASITDGLSRTAALTEWCLGTFDEGRRDPRRTLFHTPERLDAPDELDRFAAACRDIDIHAARVGGTPKGQDWTWGDLGHTLYNHALTPNHPSCLNGTGYQIGAWTAGSDHPGGVHCGFADGHVEFVRESIQTAIWRAIASRSGGEVVERN
ncbi:MAG: prepilin-type N-terminal cleavage/methylation domain-containing protein [Isosphaeraceae bacterium]|nr:MAG: prepilin-type N-terminal cleavage/methylation domain-containing protein [Isosphaeraceae bacterium]